MLITIVAIVCFVYLCIYQGKHSMVPHTKLVREKPFSWIEMCKNYIQILDFVNFDNVLFDPKKSVSLKFSVYA